MVGSALCFASGGTGGPWRRRFSWAASAKGLQQRDASDGVASVCSACHTGRMDEVAPSPSDTVGQIQLPGGFPACCVWCEVTRREKVPGQTANTGGRRPSGIRTQGKS